MGVQEVSAKHRQRSLSGVAERIRKMLRKVIHAYMCLEKRAAWASGLTYVGVVPCFSGSERIWSPFSTGRPSLP